MVTNRVTEGERDVKPFSEQLLWELICRLLIEEANSGAVSPGSELAVLNIRGKSSRFRTKPAHMVRHLPLAEGTSLVKGQLTLLLNGEPSRLSTDADLFKLRNTL
jgi:hypothetical protein